MRIVPPALTTALAEGTHTPFLKAFIGYQDGTVLWTGPALSYKLTGQSLEFEVAYNGDAGGDQTCIWLERGLTDKDGTLSVTTGKFFIESQQYFPNGRQVAKGKLFPRQYYAAAGDVSYKTVIDALCAAFGKTAVYRDPAAAWLSYQFFPDGKSIILNDPNFMHALLQQKYLIFYCDNGSNDILFYSCAPLIGGSDIIVTATNGFTQEHNNTKARLFLWRDEAGTIHTDGVASNPIHNLGYLESTAACPVRHTPTDLLEVHTRPDLRFVDGDRIEMHIGTTFTIYGLIEEGYAPSDRSHKQPRWETIIRANEVFGNTAGGAMPSTMERVSNYTPLNTSQFNGMLSGADNNLQAAMDTLDDHVHYPLQGGAASFSPADGQTYYFGTLHAEAPTTTQGRAKLFIPRAGILKYAVVVWSEFGGVAGSGETITANIRVNGTTSVLIATAANTAAIKSFGNAALNIQMAQGSYIEFEIVCPTWVTNPTLIRLTGIVFIE